MSHEAFMGAALEVARRAGAAGNMPVGAVIVRDGQILSEGPNSANSETDPTAHAEVMAIRRAAKILGRLDLTGCSLYSTFEPCPMCCWAILISGIGQLVVGGRHADFHRPEMGTYCVEKLLEMTGRPLQFVAGVRARECTEPFRAWLEHHAPPGPASWSAAANSPRTHPTR